MLLALVDADYNFVAVDVGCNGRISDGGVFAQSAIGRALNAGRLSFPEPARLHKYTVPYYVVGDEAFPLRTFLLKPYPQRSLTDEQRIFNYRLSRARRVVENAFGLLAARFRVLQRTIELPPVRCAN